MIKNILKRTFLILFLIGSFSTIEAQSFKKKRKKTAKTSTKPKLKPKKGEIQPYGKVITKDAVTDEGLFKVHSLKDKYFYEIPDSLFNKEMLMVSRISKTANGLGFGGGKINSQVLRWEKKSKKVLLRVVSHKVVAADSLPIYEAVVNSNFEPILYAFDIKAFKKDSLNPATVIEIGDFFKKDVPAIGIPKHYKKKYKISRLDNNRSYVETIKSYPLNIEARHVKTYVAALAPSNRNVGSISVEINSSMVLLPKEPMKRRYFDKRVGWFTSNQIDYGSEAQKSEKLTYIDRWRLEVKEEDIEKFKQGELVAPKKPIVYYIDRATPKKWRKYLKLGIEDWQEAFETAGFKNAIIAKDPPTIEENPEWTPEDVRYSVVRYLASPIPNANGPHVSDPRSGEILESDINWYHNVMSLVNGWFFTQTAAANPEAQTTEMSDEVMGELIRFVAAHEVGHTLGLPHNMGSSAAYKVEDLRNPEFTKKFGTAPSIMDYARFNYIAQPEDKGVSFYPKVGEYDKYAISWGYKPILNTSAKEEKDTLNAWILKHAGDPIYRFGHQQIGDIVDPSSQTEDLGDDAVLASTYGIKNLKRVVPNLIKWTTKSGKDYEDLKTMYRHVMAQFNRYMAHVSNNIGGVYETYKTAEQEGAVYTPVDKNRQKNSLLFIQEQLFKTPNWLLSTDILNKIEYSGSIERLRRIQVITLNNILSKGKMARIIENEAINGTDAYHLTDMMKDLRTGIWSELARGNKIDTYRRNLQKAHIDRLAYLMNVKNVKSRKINYNSPYFKSTTIHISQSDIRSVVRAELNILRRAIKNGVVRTSDSMSKYHLQDVLERIDLILDPRYRKY